MARAFSLCVIAVLACGCGQSSPDKEQETPSAAVPTSAGSAPTTATADGVTVPALAAMSGPPRSNKYLQMAVTEAGFDPAAPAAPPGLGFYTVGLRGMGRSRGNDFVLQTQLFVFAQNERGCISRPEPGATWLKRPIGETPVFRVSEPTEGQLAFLIPADSQRIRVLIAPSGEGGLVVPVGEEFTPAWPAPIQTIEDGSTLRVLVLPAPATPSDLPQLAAGREQVVLDFVIENLASTQGIEFATSQQLRLVDQAGAFVQSSVATKQIGCRLDDGDVIPPGHARRFLVAYDMPFNVPKRLQYRGFEVDEISVDLE